MTIAFITHRYVPPPKKHALGESCVLLIKPMPEFVICFLATVFTEMGNAEK